MDQETNNFDDPQARIQVLLEKMDQEDRERHGQDLDARRNDWQHAWYLRYTIGPFMAGQLFDLWQWALGRIDDYLWTWAQAPGVERTQTGITPPPADPRQALRKSLGEKRSGNR